MGSKFPTILLGIMAVVCLSSFSISASHPRSASKGEKIKLDPEDPLVEEIGKFCVEKQSAFPNLDFLGVIAAWKQDLSDGCQYTMTIQAYQGVISVFRATVKVQASGAKQLVKFQKTE